MSDAAGLRAFARSLVAAGVRHAVVCPGSRSAPLALALRMASGLRTRALHDERAAGFFALGMARTLRRPVALVATSGTATIELAPAVVEAQLSRVPLVVLTADRPPELRDRGAAQTIDQTHLFGRAAKWFAELPLLDGDDVTVRHWSWVAGRAAAVAAEGPAGPVHVNMPFRDPLLPDGPLVERGEGPAAAGDGGGGRVAAVAGDGPFVAAITGSRTLDARALRALAARLASARRGLIVAGPDDDPALPAALAELADATGFPILADPLSRLRSGPHDRRLVVTRADLIARHGPWIDAHTPDLVLRTGAMPTSKPILELLQRVRPLLLVLDGDAGWREPAMIPSTFVHADAAATTAGAARLLRTGPVEGATPGPSRRAADAAWTADWLEAERAADAAMRDWLGGLDEPFEGLPYPALAELLPDGAVLWAGNSMPVRDLDAWLPATERAIAVHSNRGANGIDGVVSTALGSAAVADGPVVLVVGDLSFLHDLNALVAARLHRLSATMVLVNNDGGGIFSFLPLAQPGAAVEGSGLPEHYEELFGTPHGVDFGPIVGALGAEHRVVAGGDLRAALAASIGRPGIRVLELRTDRGRNVQLHREVAAAVARALAGLVTGVPAA